MLPRISSRREYYLSRRDVDESRPRDDVQRSAGPRIIRSTDMAVYVLSSTSCIDMRTYKLPSAAISYHQLTTINDPFSVIGQSSEMYKG